MMLVCRCLLVLVLVMASLCQSANSFECYRWGSFFDEPQSTRECKGNIEHCYWLRLRFDTRPQNTKIGVHRVEYYAGGCMSSVNLNTDGDSISVQYTFKFGCKKQDERCKDDELVRVDTESSVSKITRRNVRLCCCKTEFCNSFVPEEAHQGVGYPYVPLKDLQEMVQPFLQCERDEQTEDHRYCERPGEQAICVLEGDATEFKCVTKGEKAENAFDRCLKEDEDTPIEWYWTKTKGAGSSAYCLYKNDTRTCCCRGPVCNRKHFKSLPEPTTSTTTTTTTTTTTQTQTNTTTHQPPSITQAQQTMSVTKAMMVTCIVLSAITCVSLLVVVFLIVLLCRDRRAPPVPGTVVPEARASAPVQSVSATTKP